MYILETLSIWGALRILYIIYMAVAIVTAVTIVLNNRTPIKTIAWVLVILTIPFFGLIIYFIFGRDNRRRRLIGKKFLNQIQKRALNRYIRSCDTLKIPAEYTRLVKFFENVADAYPVTGNQIEIINEGSTFLIRLLQEIKKAEEHIHLQIFPFDL